MSRHVLRAYWKEAWYETVRMLRAPAFAGPFLILPAGLYLLFGVVLFGDAVRQDPKAGPLIWMGFSVFGAMGPGMFGFGIPLAMEREQGLFVLKRALPSPRGAALLAKLAMSMLFVAIVMVTMACVAPIGHLPLRAGQLLGVSVVNVLGALPFCAMGLFVGSWASAKAAPAFVNLFFLPMIYLSNFLIPLPKSMDWIALASPAYHLSRLTLSAMGAPSEGSLVVHFAVLACVTLALTAFAVRRLERAG